MYQSVSLTVLSIFLKEIKHNNCKPTTPSRYYPGKFSVFQPLQLSGFCFSAATLLFLNKLGPVMDKPLQRTAVIGSQCVSHILVIVYQLDLSPTCLPLWVLWAAWFYICLPLFSHLSSTLVFHSGCSGPHDFTLVSHSGWSGPHDFTFVSHLFSRLTPNMLLLDLCQLPLSRCSIGLFYICLGSTLV